jgi:hypothetical protein
MAVAALEGTEAIRSPIHAGRGAAWPRTMSSSHREPSGDPRIDTRASKARSAAGDRRHREYRCRELSASALCLPVMKHPGRRKFGRRRGPVGAEDDIDDGKERGEIDVTMHACLAVMQPVPLRP